jgi:tetratricopeptide (TPR) repeat protein
MEKLFKNIYKIVFLIFGIFLLISCSVSQDESRNKYIELLKKSSEKLNYIDTASLKKMAVSHVIKGSQFQQQGKFAESVIEFQQAGRLDSNAGIFYAMAKSYREMEKYDLSLENCLMAVRIEPNFLPAVDYLSDLYMYNLQIENAISVAEQALKLDSTKERNLKLAWLYELSEPQKSIEIYESFSRTEPDLYIYNRLANLYTKLNQNEKRLNTLERMYMLSPGNLNTAASILENHVNSQQFSDGLDFIIKIEKNFSSKELTNLYGYLATALINNRDSVDSIIIKNFINKIDNRFYFETQLLLLSGYLADYIKDSVNTDRLFTYTLKSTDSIPDLPLQISNVYNQNGKYQKSLSILNEFQIKYPENSKYPFFIGVTYSLMQNDSLALNYFYESLKIDSLNVDIWIQIANIFDKTGDFAKSDSAFDQALKLAPDSPLVNNNYAYSLAQRNMNLKMALRMSSTAIEQLPNNAAYLDTYAWINFKLKNYETALEYMEKAINTGDAVGEVFEHLGDILMKLERFSDAKKAYQEALNLEPDRESAKLKLNDLIKE